MAQVSRSIELAASTDTVWAQIGGFQALADWHPAVQKSTREDIDGVEHRHLDLGGGMVIVEKSLGASSNGGTRSYGYEIVLPGPLPVADYRSVLTVAPSGDGTVVTWTSTFTGTAEGAEDAIAGVYDGGLAALMDRFGG